MIGTSLHISACLQSNLLSTYLLYLHIKLMSDLSNISCFDLGFFFWKAQRTMQLRMQFQYNVKHWIIFITQKWSYKAWLEANCWNSVILFWVNYKLNSKQTTFFVCLFLKQRIYRIILSLKIVVSSIMWSLHCWFWHRQK